MFGRHLDLVPEPSPTRPAREGTGRRRVILWLAAFVFLLFVVSISQTAFNLKFINPESNQQTQLFAVLSALIFLLLVAITFVLLRNVLKLYAERRLGVLGSKFRTRMLIGALFLSLLPVLAQFGSAYLLLNRSIDKWFSRPVEEVRQDTAAVAAMLATYAGQNARSEAAAIAAAPEVRSAFQNGNFSPVTAEFRRHAITLQGGFAVALTGDEMEASFGAPAAWPLLQPQLHLDKAATNQPQHFVWEGREYILGIAPVGDRGMVIAAMPLPADFSRTVQQIEESQQRYFSLSRERKSVRRTYMGLLLLLTMVVLFASTWLALFVAKLVTRPVEALAGAMQQISQGRLDYRVEVSAADELGDLVRSFNRMAAELEGSRSTIEASSRELADANLALEQRRKYIEIILESIPTGVASLDGGRRLTHMNHAFLRLFGQPQTTSTASLVGKPLADVLPSETLADLEPLLRRADRMGMTSTQMELTVYRAQLNVAVTVATLQQETGAQETLRAGYVLIFEDLSELLRAQKQTAWREVARRVAHEIKNPLTPIALSAERILRHLDKGSAPDEGSLRVIQHCAQTIGGAVETVRTLVNEFSTLASFPAAIPQPANINQIVASALALFDGRLDAIHIHTNLNGELPPVMADADAMKRAVANLVDNAAEAMEDSLVREIHISTTLVASGDAVEITVADSGHGVSQELKEKLFLPYFSTKQRGTGLGLAIVNRIVEDHHGSIRVEENHPVGTRFIIELPVAPDAVGDPAPTQHA